MDTRNLQLPWLFGHWLCPFCATLRLLQLRTFPILASRERLWWVSRPKPGLSVYSLAKYEPLSDAVGCFNYDITTSNKFLHSLLIKYGFLANPPFMIFLDYGDLPAGHVWWHQKVPVLLFPSAAPSDWTQRVNLEFWAQGDEERRLNLFFGEDLRKSKAESLCQKRAIQAAQIWIWSGFFSQQTWCFKLQLLSIDQG